MCTFHNIHIYVLIYADMTILGSSVSAINDLVSTLHATFALKDLDTLNYFLGVEVRQIIDSGLFLSQIAYINELLDQTNFHNANHISTPILSSLILSARE